MLLLASSGKYQKLLPLTVKLFAKNIATISLRKYYCWPLLGNINSPRSGGRSFHTICVGAASGNNDVRHTFDSCNVSILGVIIIAIIIFVIVDVIMGNK